MSDSEDEAHHPAETTPRLTACRCGRICSDYPRCRHPDWRGETPPGTPEETIRDEDR